MNVLQDFFLHDRLDVAEVDVNDVADRLVMEIGNGYIATCLMYWHDVVSRSRQWEINSPNGMDRLRLQASGQQLLTQSYPSPKILHVWYFNGALF